MVLIQQVSNKQSEKRGALASKGRKTTAIHAPELSNQNKWTNHSRVRFHFSILTEKEHTMANLICNWSASTCTSMKQPEAGTFHVQS